MRITALKSMPLKGTSLPAQHTQLVVVRAGVSRTLTLHLQKDLKTKLSVDAMLKT